MAELFVWIVVMIIVAALGLAAAVGVRAYMSGQSPSELLFKPRAEPRIGVIEHASVDGKRRLLLIRRDDVEHLIMTGGPVDVVIETGIGDKPARAVEAASSPAATATVFTRAPRGFGQAAGGSDAS